MFIIDCKKDQTTGLWCFDFQFTRNFSVVNEPLMEQATVLADEILVELYTKIPEMMSITFDQSPLSDDEEAVLLYSREEDGGSVYQVSELFGKTVEENREVWLCPVLKNFFGVAPKELHVWVNEFKKQEV
jgi:hypothetical protein